jgi:general secretion pathway protein G
MIRSHSRTEKRAAFTLIELMVVILIIAVLVSLLLAAVSGVMRRIPVVQTSTDISQFSVALNAFMSDYNLDIPPPSTLVLYETNPLQGPSANFLQKVFGKNLGSGVAFVDWNGDGVANGPWTLEGEQCLVFYLSGINNTGFSTNNINPAATTPSGKRRGPYITFQPSRLVPGNVVNSALNAFPVYIDSWQVKAVPHPPPYANGVPYAYFSSNGIMNGYTLTDCANIGAAPYFTAASVYTNPNTYQIISAGKDGAFGTTGWNPAGGTTGPAADDQSNFSSTLLGAGQN